MVSRKKIPSLLAHHGHKRRTDPQSFYQLFGFLKRLAILAGLVSCALASQAPLAYAAGTSIVIAHAETPTNEATLHRLLADWQSRHPGVGLVLRHTAVKNLGTALTDQGADVILTPVDHLARLAADPKVTDAMALVADGRLRKDLLSLGRIGGRQIGVPYYAGSQLMLFYDKRLVKTPPTTWQDLVATAKAMRVKRQTPHGLLLPSTDPYWLLPFLASSGPWPFHSGPGGWSISFTHDAVRRGAELFRSLLEPAGILPPQCDYYCAMNGFKARKAAFFVSGDWNVADLLSVFGDDLGIAPLPATAAGPMPTQIHGGFVVLRHAATVERRELVESLTREVTGNRFQLAYALTTKRLPAAQGLLGAVSEDPRLGEVVNASIMSRPLPSTPATDAFWAKLTMLHRKLLSGTLTPIALAAALTATP